MSFRKLPLLRLVSASSWPLYEANEIAAGRLCVEHVEERDAFKDIRFATFSLLSLVPALSWWLCEAKGIAVGA